MSNYSPITNFAALDLLVSGNPSKAAKGASITAELNAIATAIATKYDPAILAAAAQILFGNGSAGSPSIAFNAYTNTGLYAAAANSLGFSANGVSAGNIASTGAWNLNAPTGAVDTLTVAAASGRFAGTFNGNAAANNSFGFRVFAGSSTSDVTLDVINQAASQHYLQVQGDGQAYVFAPTAATAGPANTFQVGYLDIPQNSQTVNYQLVMSDRGKAVELSGGATQVTIPANGTVAFPIGTTIMIVNNTAGSITIPITTDTLRWSATGGTGTRTLAQYGVATIRKFGNSTNWLITGTGLT